MRGHSREWVDDFRVTNQYSIPAISHEVQLKKFNNYYANIAGSIELEGMNGDRVATLYVLQAD